MIEDILRGRVRIRILKELAHDGALSVQEIHRRVGSGHNWVLQHLRILAEAGVVQEKRVGKQRVFMFADSAKAIMVKEFFLRWNKS